MSKIIVLFETDSNNGIIESAIISFDNSNAAKDFMKSFAAVKTKYNKTAKIISESAAEEHRRRNVVSY